MHDFLAGIATAGCWAVSLIFLRLWRDSGDRLFAMFAAAFLVLSVNWVGLAMINAARGKPSCFLRYPSGRLRADHPRDRREEPPAKDTR